MEYHKPVLLEECMEALQINPNGVYVDATFGGGGHSKRIVEALDKEGTLIGFDQDEDAEKNILIDDRFIFVNNNFQYLKRYLRLHGIKQVDGILADLGVSSHQLDTAERGFSFRFDADLDMRMNQQGEFTAADVLNTYSVQDLQQLFSQYGEVRNAKTLANKLVEVRATKAFKSTGDLVFVLESVMRGNRQRYLAQVFQALRIEVNQELEVLKTFLQQAMEILNEEGRLVVISYHSLEDRLVKNFIKYGNFKGEAEKDFYGNIHRPFKLITKKAILPSKEECNINPRARSAKLRVAEKN